jgi:hypothetical protein
MTTVKDFTEHGISRRRFDPSNDIETPLLSEASGTRTGGATRGGENNVQGSTSNEEPSIPFPKWLMLASIFVALFASTTIAMGFLQTSENQENWSFFPRRGVIGPSFFIDLFLLTNLLFAVLLVVYFGIMKDDVKARPLFATFLTVGIILGLGMAMLAITTAPDSSTREHRYNDLPLGFFCFSIGVFFSFFAILECKCDDIKPARLRWSRHYYSFLSFTLGWLIGVFTGLVLARSILGRRGK